MHDKSWSVHLANGELAGNLLSCGVQLLAWKFIRHGAARPTWKPSSRNYCWELLNSLNNKLAMTSRVAFLAGTYQQRLIIKLKVGYLSADCDCVIPWKCSTSKHTKGSSMGISHAVEPRHCQAATPCLLTYRTPFTGQVRQPEHSVSFTGLPLLSIKAGQADFRSIHLQSCVDW